MRCGWIRTLVVVFDIKLMDMGLNGFELERNLKT